MPYTTVSYCGNDHIDWLRNIDFYEVEFNILDERLLEIVSKNTGQDALKGLEHFQNQFIIQRNNIDELRHSIHEHSSHVANDSKLHAGKMHSHYTMDHDNLRSRFESFVKVAQELRHDFNQYLSKWM